jgi:hypothetical protein
MNASKRVVPVVAGVVGGVLCSVVSFAAGALLFALLGPDRSTFQNRDGDFYPLALVFFGIVGLGVGAIIALVVAAWIGIRKPKLPT